MASSSTAASRSIPSWLARWSPFAPTTRPDHITASEVTRVQEPVHENQRVEKSFTITAPKHDDDDDDDGRASDHHTARGIHQVCVHAPGLTIVRVRPELVDDVGPDVLARVRVTSNLRDHLARLTVDLDDKHDLAIKYDAKRGTVGHLVTEVEVPRAAHVNQVVAMCRGDVVVREGVLGRPSGAASAAEANEGAVATTANSPVDDTPGVLSTLGSRLFLTERRLDVDDLLVGTIGSGSVNVVAQALLVNQSFYGIVIGTGRVNMAAQIFCSRAANLGAFGGGAFELTVPECFHAKGMAAAQRGSGSVRVSAPLQAIVGKCLFQDVHVGGGSGSVDLGDVPALEAAVEIGRPAGGVARIRSPLEKLTVKCASSSTNNGGAIQHVGALPPQVVHANASSTPDDAGLLTEVTADSLVPIREGLDSIEHTRVIVPTIEAAFETPVALEKPSEGWLRPAIAPALRSLLPF